MKKATSILLALIMVLSLTACSGNSAETTVPVDTTADPVETVESIETTAPVETEIPETVAPTVALESSGTLGDYGVEIHDYQLAEDYNGDPVILISYTFTNNSEESDCAAFCVYVEAFQNGISLESAYMVEYDGYDVSAESKEIKPGYSIDLMAAFALSDANAPVEVEVSELISFSDDVLGKVFYISDQSEIVLSQAPVGDFLANIGDYVVSIISHEIVDDYEGNPALLLELGFTNNDDDTTNFATAILLTAFQDGIEIENAYLMDSQCGTTQMANVRPGAGHTVFVAFELDSETAVVELEFSELISFSDEVTTAEINLSK